MEQDDLPNDRSDLLPVHVQEVPLSIEPIKRPRIRKKRRVRRPPRLDLNPEKILSIPGVKKLTFSFSTQRTLNCVVGEDVTAEYPWKRLHKEDLTDNLELYEAESDFFPIMDDILAFPGQDLLIGYLPSENQDFEEFYICVTVTSEDTVKQIVNNILEQREARLNNSILKDVGFWASQGSDTEVNEQLVKNNRPLLEVECESLYPIRDTPSRFKLILAEHTKNGYVELLSKRTTFLNLQRRRNDVAIQVAPAVESNTAQTQLTYPKNISTEYHYEYKPAGKLSKEFHSNIKSFVTERMEEINDIMYVNSNINLYKDDYLSLVKDVRTTITTDGSVIKECFSLYDQNVEMGEVIADVSWHPMWSGILAIAYSNEAYNLYKKFNPNEDEVITALYGVKPVQLWSFADNLTAKLFLEVPRQVTILSFCPTNENILVGGCINGEVLVWDITNRLNKVEEEEILTPPQQLYRTRMQSLMTWMKNTKDPKFVRTTVTSDLEYSHTSSVTDIKWISPYREVTRSGKVLDIPDEDDRISLQFVTSAEDGTALVWDLRAKPLRREGGYKPRRKLRRLKRRPSALITDVSPLKDFNRILKPTFKINILAPNTSRNLPLTAINFRSNPIVYEQVNPNPNCKYNMTDRVLHRAIYSKPNYPLLTKFIAGTIEGDFLIASWEGFDFNAGEVVNKEICKIEFFGKYHDGPIVALDRSVVFPNLVLTVGGKIFALWRIDFINKPVLWRKSTHGRYTHGVWNMYKPSVFRLLRDDGCVEFWNLRVRSDRYQHLTFTSGGYLTGTYTNPLSGAQKMMGIADYTSALRLFVISQSLSSEENNDISGTYKICEKAADIKLMFSKWQEDWKRKNADLVTAKQQEELALRKQKEEENKTHKAPQEEVVVEGTEQAAKLEAGYFAKAAERAWILKEQERMKAVLLQKRMLDFGLLEKQQIPLRRIADEEKALQEKIKRRQSNSQKIFNESVAMLFPDILEKKPPPPPDKYAGGDCFDVQISHFKNYRKLEEANEEFVGEHKYILPFNWFILLRGGKKIRKAIDGYYSRHNHKHRLMKEKEEAELEYLAWSNRKEEVQPKASLGSIDYGDVFDKDQTEDDAPTTEADAEQ